MGFESDKTSLNPYWIDFSQLYNRADSISRAYHSGNLVFFLGSGASKAYANTMPNWNELLTGLQAEVRIENVAYQHDISTLIKQGRFLLAAEALKRYGQHITEDRDNAVDNIVARLLRQRIDKSEINPALHLSVLDFSVPIFTTNYDNIIEDLILEYKVSGYGRRPYTYEDQKNAADLMSPIGLQENYVFKLHGSIERNQRLILDEGDYAEFYFYKQWPKSLELLRHILATKMVIFIGFSLTDPDIMSILREATRYSSSYQHIALLHDDAITSIEQDVLRAHYRVEPILYHGHDSLPLYVMEMRNFYYRKDVALQLRPETGLICKAVNKIIEDEKLPKNSSAILFGSYSKYGNLSLPHSDLDILFLTDRHPQQRRVKNDDAENFIGRKIDVTIMERDELERLLHLGDPFASSVLVTGCPLTDPNDRYGILNRGFRGVYQYSSVLANAVDRYRMRWLRLWIFRHDHTPDYYQACHQWSVTLMQYNVIRQDYSLDSLLSVSLLGNARFVIREFAARFRNVDEEYFVSLIRIAKGSQDIDSIERPKIASLVKEFLKILKPHYSKEELEMLVSGEYIQNETTENVFKFYKNLSIELDAMRSGKMVLFGYGITKIEESFLQKITKENKNSEFAINSFDYPFFMILHHSIQDRTKSQENELSEKDLFSLCDEARQEWIQMV